MQLEERFNSKYEIDTITGCWNWKKPDKTLGYGTFSFKGKPKFAHRISYELHREPIPKGLVIDHLCRNRACVNPEHLEVVTAKENVLRGQGVSAVNKRKTHCNRGHFYDQENTVREKRGRACRKCRRILAYGRPDKIQVIKTYTHNGKTQTTLEWAEEIGVKKDTLYRRIETYKWPLERALTRNELL